MVLGRVIPDGEPVLFGDRLVVEIWPVRRRAGMGDGSLSLNVFELFSMVWAAYEVIVIRNDLLRREGEVVLMRGVGRSVDVKLQNGQG